jgi:hypothetical protein
MMTISLGDVFVRTEAGRGEIRARTEPLSRPARNLLLVIDASCNGLQWIAKVHGSTEADLRQLVDARLIAPAQAAAGVRQAGPAVSLDQALQRWTYNALYTLLTQEARERFGLIKGYRLILEIEGATGLSGLQAVARKFVEQIRKAHGEEPAARFRRQLGASD